MRVLATCLAVAASGAIASPSPSAEVVIEARLTNPQPVPWAARSSFWLPVECGAEWPARPPRGLKPVDVEARGPAPRLFLLHRALLR
jgi:hypothetical protein